MLTYSTWLLLRSVCVATFMRRNSQWMSVVYHRVNTSVAGTWLSQFIPRAMFPSF